MKKIQPQKEMEDFTVTPEPPTISGSAPRLLVERRRKNKEMETKKTSSIVDPVK